MLRIAELRTRLLYTIALLAVYRIGIFISVPGVDRAAMNAFMDAQRQSGGVVNLLNLFSGGALAQMSIFGLGGGGPGGPPAPGGGGPRGPGGGPPGPLFGPPPCRCSPSPPAPPSSCGW